MKERKPIRSRTGVTLWMMGMSLFLFLLITITLTWVTAKIISDDLYEEYWNYDLQFIGLDHLDERQLWMGANLLANDRVHLFADTWMDYSETIQLGAVIYDRDGAVAARTANSMLLDYYTEATWKQWGHAPEDGLAVMEFDPYFMTEEARSHTGWHIFEVIRITGTMEEGQLYPSKMEVITGSDYADWRFQADNFSKAYRGTSDWVAEYEAWSEEPWKTVYVGIPRDTDQVYYSVNSQSHFYDYGEPLEQNGKTYEHLMAWLEDVGLVKQENEKNLWNTVLKFENKLQSDDYQVVTAIQYSPIKLAASALWKLEILIFLVLLLLSAVLRNVLVKHLVLPLETVTKAITDGWQSTSMYGTWQEPRLLDRQYYDTRKERQIDKSELNRLNVALQYAKTAEENRRKMTAAMAHELKTPLAVIHSYAEGLKERIAEEKREQYLDTILDETEELDAMVLEMLDLSRLEAGKVKLDREEFSLSGLAQGVFERLQLAAEAKELDISFRFLEEHPVVADEGRISQVILNLASNAVKYTPVGGKIKVFIFETRGHTWFKLENESQPFTDEELTKVWDTFYRTDKARTGDGTGLGLAISRSIIQLHGGECRVKNTDIGVEFSFWLPRG